MGHGHGEGCLWSAPRHITVTYTFDHPYRCVPEDASAGVRADTFAPTIRCPGSCGDVVGYPAEEVPDGLQFQVTNVPAGDYTIESYAASRASPTPELVGTTAVSVPWLSHLKSGSTTTRARATGEMPRTGDLASKVICARVRR